MILSKAHRVGFSCLSRGVWYHLRCPRVSHTSVQGWLIQNKTLGQQLEARKDLDTYTAFCTAFCMSARDASCSLQRCHAATRLVHQLPTFPEPQCPVLSTISYNKHRITGWLRLEKTSVDHLVQPNCSNRDVQSRLSTKMTAEKNIGIPLCLHQSVFVYVFVFPPSEEFKAGYALAGCTAAVRLCQPAGPLTPSFWALCCSPCTGCKKLLSPHAT